MELRKSEPIFISQKFRPTLSDHKVLLLLLAIAFFLRITGFMIYLYHGGTGIEPDSESYLIPALSLKTNFQFGNSAFRTPGYPFLLMITMLLFGNSFYYGLVVLQIIFNIIAIFYVYRSCILLTQKKQAGYIAVIIASLNFLDIFYCYQILTDSIAQSLALISLYYFIYFLQTLKENIPSAKPLILASVLLTVTVFIRPAAMYLPIAIMLGLSFAAVIYKRYKSILLIFICIMLLVNTPIILWSNRNERIVGVNGFSTVSAVNMYTYNAAAVYANQNGMSYYDALDFLQSGKDPILQEYMQTMSSYDAYGRRGWEIISSDFAYYLQCCLKDCVYLTIYPGAMSLDFVSESVSDLVAQIKESSEISLTAFFQNKEELLSFCILGMDVLILTAIFVFAVIGLLRLMKKDWLQASLITGVLLYNYVTMCQPMGIGTFSRFRLSFSMILCICAAYGFYITFQKKHNGN